MAEIKKQEIDRPSQVNRSDRPQRVSINGLRDKMSVSGQQPGWHYCWVNEDNVEQYKLGGYEFVTHEVQIGVRKIDQASMTGGRIAIPGGNGFSIFLMRCPEDVFEEEQALVNERTDSAEQSLRENLNSGADGRYGKVEIKRRKS